MTATYRLNLQVPNQEILEGQLNLGGCTPDGDEIGINSYYLTLNGRPFIVVSGEFQPTRYPSVYWEEELLKIKAGGINTVA